jgi:hypothetical protein
MSVNIEGRFNIKGYGGGTMDAIQQKLFEQAGTCQCSQQSDDGTQIPWKCHYRSEDDLLLASKHAYFQAVSISPDMHRTGNAACLNVQIDIHRVSLELLSKAVIRVIVQNTSGTRFFLWESGAIDQINLADSKMSHSMCMPIPMPCSQLKRMKAGGAHRLQLILEGEWGSVLDSASGEIVIL